MPKAMHKSLAKMAKKKGLKGKSAKKYIYGTLNKAKSKSYLADAVKGRK